MTFTKRPADKHIVVIYDDLWNRIFDRYSPDGFRAPHEAINMLIATGFMFALTDLPNQRMWRYDNMPAHKHMLWVFDDLWKNIAVSCFGCKLPDGDYVTDDQINAFLSAGLGVMSEGLPAYTESCKWDEITRDFI